MAGLLLPWVLFGCSKRVSFADSGGTGAAPEPEDPDPLPPEPPDPEPDPEPEPPEPVPDVGAPCPAGTLDCPCDGARCDDGLVCEEGVCTELPSDCGNGIQEAGEACDDGNDDNGDACVEGCVLATCGDGFVEAGVEVCDDGNRVDTDACSNDCARFAPAFGAGRRHTCAARRDGELRCWGLNYDAQLGLGHTETIGDDETPAQAGAVQTGGSVIQVVAGLEHTCALLHGGDVRCWGVDGPGTLGRGPGAPNPDGMTPDAFEPVDVGEPVAQLSGGGTFTCARTQRGAVRCWGAATHGQLGHASPFHIGDDETVAEAGDVPLDGIATQIASGWGHTCALLEDGRLKCWGYNYVGQLGLGHIEPISETVVPADLPAVDVGPDPVVEIVAGGHHACVVQTEGRVRCWGYGTSGQLGAGHTNRVGDDELPSAVPHVDVGAPVRALSAGYRTTCAILEDRSVKCWGDNWLGQLGYGHTEAIGDDETPAMTGPINLGAGAIHVTSGDMHTCAWLATGAIRCWGNGDYGQLGYGHTEIIGDDEHPVDAGDVPVF